jgi:hypothetical protein
MYEQHHYVLPEEKHTLLKASEGYTACKHALV